VRRHVAAHRILVGKNVTVREIEAALDGIPQTAPPPPAGREGEWPPGGEMKEWLNLVLDVEMRDAVDRWFDGVEEAVSRANREAPSDPRDVREYLAYGHNSRLLALLRDPAHTLSMTMREYLASRIEGRPKRPANRPKKTPDQSRADTFVWRAVEDARRLEQVLGEVYPQRRRGLVKEACVIAAARWGISDRTVTNKKDRGGQHPLKLCDFQAAMPRRAKQVFRLASA
jgi:hypothetical protein